MGSKLNSKALSLAGGILAALCMLVLGIFGNLGIYEGAVQAMSNWHMFFDLSVGGIIAGMVEAFVWTFIALYIFAWLYNMLLEKKK